MRNSKVCLEQSPQLWALQSSCLTSGLPRVEHCILPPSNAESPQGVISKSPSGLIYISLQVQPHLIKLVHKTTERYSWGYSRESLACLIFFLSELRSTVQPASPSAFLQVAILRSACNVLSPSQELPSDPAGNVSASNLVSTNSQRGKPLSAKYK